MPEIKNAPEKDFKSGENHTEESIKEYLTYSIGNEEYAIEISNVNDIIQLSISPITPLPMVPEYIKGIINLRGKITPIIDVRLRLGLPERPYDDQCCIIVLEHEGIKVGLIVDTVEETCKIPNSIVVPPPVSKEGFSNKYVSGIASMSDGVKLILDCHSFLATDTPYSMMENDIML